MYKISYIMQHIYRTYNCMHYILKMHINLKYDVYFLNCIMMTFGGPNQTRVM